MGKLLSKDPNMEQMKIDGGGAFQFSAVKMEDLGALEYTLVTIAMDCSGSLGGFEANLQEMLINIIGACQKSPRAENLMLRYLQFDNKVSEVHGFKLLTTVDVNDYKKPLVDNTTALYDATYSSVGASVVYAKKLIQQGDFNANAICFIITDGLDNASKVSPEMIKDFVAKTKIGEEIESIITILVGINTNSQEVKDGLDKFSREAELTQYVDAGAATSQRLAKLAAFVSKSISSQSQALGTGGPSQPLTF